MAASGYFESRFGDQTLLIAQIDTDEGRDIAVQSPARGSRHYLQDRGAKLGKVECEILFVGQIGKASYIDRFQAFRALVAQAEPQIFSHPLIGSFRARAEGGRHSASSEAKRITYQCSFLPEDEPQPTTPVGAGVAPVAGADTISVAVADAQAGLTAGDIATLQVQVPTTDPARTWLDDLKDFFSSAADEVDTDTQAVISSVATYTGYVNTAIEDLDLASDITRWNTYRAMIGLISAVQLAGEALTADDQNLITLHVGPAARPLLAICAEVYGPADAADRAEAVTRLNRIRTPNRIAPGTTIKLPAPRSP